MTTRRQYLLNIAWSWVGALAMILSGLLVSPYLIRKLGADRFGVWALALSFVDYFWLLDFGVRPATVKLGAEYRALGREDALNRLVNTSLLYALAAGALILLLVCPNTGSITRFFRITEPAFPVLIVMVSVSWALGVVANVFAAGLEAFQRFDISNHILITFIILRSVLLLLLAAWGFGLVAMGVALTVTQVLMYAGFFIAFLRIYPNLRLSPALATKEQGREIWLYARQMISGVISGRLLQSAVPSIVARLLPVRNVAYFTVTQKVLDYAGEGIGRLGLITAPRAADWMARGYRDNILSLARYGNRYALCIWIVIATFLFVYAEPLFRIWISPEFAGEAAVLVPILLCGYTLWEGQFISASILMGIGRYGRYSNSLLIEAVVSVAAFAAVLPIWGLAGGAVVLSLFMSLNRCLNLSLIFCREFDLKPVRFLRGIYAAPLALAALDVALLSFAKGYWLPGHSWAELIAAGMLNTVLLGAAMVWLIAEPFHRQFALDVIMRRWRAWTTPQIQPRNL